MNALRDEILKHQRGDGGWSLFLDENQSDPLATGEALYVLQSSASDAPTAEAIARAQLWLLRTQRPDGSWPVDVTHISATDRSAPDKAGSIKNATGIFTYWGCSWATLGLLQGVPLTDSPKPAAAISNVSLVRNESRLLRDPHPHRLPVVDLDVCPGPLVIGPYRDGVRCPHPIRIRIVPLIPPFHHATDEIFSRRAHVVEREVSSSHPSPGGGGRYLSSALLCVSFSRRMNSRSTISMV